VRNGRVEGLPQDGSDELDQTDEHEELDGAANLLAISTVPAIVIGGRASFPYHDIVERSAYRHTSIHLALYYIIQVSPIDPSDERPLRPVLYDCDGRNPEMMTKSIN
jgi:hypothetical protein